MNKEIEEKIKARLGERCWGTRDGVSVCSIRCPYRSAGTCTCYNTGIEDCKRSIFCIRNDMPVIFTFQSAREQWITHDGHHIRPEDLQTDHLINAIKMVERECYSADLDPEDYLIYTLLKKELSRRKTGMKELGIGDKCYIDGYICDIQTEKTSKFGVYPLQNVMPETIREILLEDAELTPDRLAKNGNTVFYVTKSRCEPLIDKLFTIGDKIVSQVGSLKGVVSGYEPSSNRAICLSEKASRYPDKRTRYLYKPHEILKDIHIVLLDGRQYRINGHIAIANPMPGDADLMSFVSVAGELLKYNVPRDITPEDLRARFNIRTIELV